MINNITIIGRLGGEPEKKTSSSGISYINISVAVNSSMKNRKTNEYDTSWFMVTAFGKTADFLCSYCHKGDLVYFSGECQIVNYEKEGTERTIVKIISNIAKIVKAKNDSIDKVENINSVELDEDIPF